MKTKYKTIAQNEQKSMVQTERKRYQPDNDTPCVNHGDLTDDP